MTDPESESVSGEVNMRGPFPESVSQLRDGVGDYMRDQRNFVVTHRTSSACNFALMMTPTKRGMLDKAEAHMPADFERASTDGDMSNYDETESPETLCYSSLLSGNLHTSSCPSLNAFAQDMRECTRVERRCQVRTMRQRPVLPNTANWRAETPSQGAFGSMGLCGWDFCA